MYQVYKEGIFYYIYHPSSKSKYETRKSVDGAFAQLRYSNLSPFPISINAILLAETQSLDSLHTSHPELFI